MEELQREVGITFSCLFFYLIPPSLPPGVMTKVLARKAIVKTAKDFAITGSAACPGIKFIYIGKAEVESKIKALDELAFSGIKQLKGIWKVHHMEVWIQTKLNFC